MAEVQSAGSAWRTPPLLIGECDTIWTTSFAKYVLPYRVFFGSRGHFRWWAPYKDGSATEIGEGMYLTPPVSAKRSDGLWETHYFSANRFTPDPANSTNCCCEYVGGQGSGKPRILADYIVAAVPRSSHLPMEEVCAPFVRRCPVDNATALQEMGHPFIEVYATCAPSSAEGLPVLVASAALLALLVVGALLTLLRRLWRAGLLGGAKAPGLEGPEAAGYLSLGEGEGWQDVEALRRSLAEQLLVHGGVPAALKGGNASIPATPSTVTNCTSSPALSDASWSRSTTLLSRWLGDDLPPPAWSRASTERLGSAASSWWFRRTSEPATVTLQ